MIRKSFVIVCLAAIMILVLADIACAATFFEGDPNLSVKKTVNDDIFAASGTLTVDSRVAGNAFLAGGSLDIAGSFANLFIGAGQVTLDGDIENSAYVGCGTLTVRAKTGRDLMIGCGSLSVDKNSEIGQDLFFGANMATIDGKVGRNLKGGGASITINGTVEGDVDIEADQIEFGPDTVVKGDVVYRSNNEAQISRGADIQGKVTRKPSRYATTDGKPLTTAEKVWAFISARFLGLLAAFVTGIVLLLLWPKRVTEAAWLIMEEPWKTGGIGLLFLLVGPAVIIIALITVFGAPSALMAGTIYLSSLYLAKIFMAIFLGKAILDRWQPAARPIAHLIVGLFVVAILTAIPVVNIFVIVIYLIFGFGAIAMAFYKLSREDHTAMAGPKTPISQEVQQ